MMQSAVERQVKREFSGRTLKQYLSLAGLPQNYPKLSRQDQKRARMKVLTSWFDADQPNVLCTDLDNYIHAHFLWVEYYYKPAPRNEGVYFYDDPLNKYDMIRFVLQPPKDNSLASMSVITATRRTGKTQTLVVEAMPLICIARPFSKCLLSEFNDVKTREVISAIREQVEENERIHEDFGGQGTLFPRKSQNSWCAHRLKFSHLPGCEILGHSLGSSQRGRGPIYGVVDDAEDEERVHLRSFRTWFFGKLLNAYARMFTRGGVMIVVGTPIPGKGGSCIAMLMRNLVELPDQSDKDDPVVDRRLEVFHKGNFSIIRRNDEGGFVSLQPQRLTAVEFEEQLKRDPISARAEVLCEAVVSGMKALPFHPVRHGFMREKVGDDHHMYHLGTGESMPWNDFVKSLHVVGAVDMADGQSVDSDFGAVVMIGISEKGLIYVLDVFNRKCFYEKLVEAAFDMSVRWDCKQLGFESVSMQKVVTRLTREMARKRFKEMGSGPNLREIENAGRNKVQRILSVRDLFIDGRMFFLYFDDHVDRDGIVHHPDNPVHFGYYKDLLDQVNDFTDHGVEPNDAIDAMEMAIRLSRGIYGRYLEPELPNNLDAQIERRREGEGPMPVVPVQFWSEKMHREHEAMLCGTFDEETLPIEVPYL